MLSTSGFDNFELLYDTTCIPIRDPCSDSNCSPDLQSDKSDCQTEADEMLSPVVFESDVSTDMIKSFDSYNQIKAPANCFLLYRSHVLKDIIAENPGHSSRSITSLIAENWKNEPVEVKNNFKEIAAKEKAQFMKRFPKYRRVFKPRVRKRANSLKKSCLSKVAFAGDTPLNLNQISNDSSLFFSSYVGRKRSYSMPQLSEVLKQGSEFASNYHFDLLGPLLPLTHLNSYKKTCLSEALGKLN